MTRQLFLDDFSNGMTFEGRWHHVRNEMFTAFASMTGDDHPIHYDAEYARNTRFKRPVAHGLLVASLTALGATALSPALRDSMTAFLSAEMSFVAPVFAGDRVRPVFTVRRIEPRPGKDTGRIDFAVEMRKEDGTVCLRGTHAYLLRKHAQETEGSRRGTPAHGGVS